MQKRRKGKLCNAAYAKRLSYVRMRAKRKEGKKIALDGALRTFVEDGLMDDQSPEAIEGRIKHVETNLERTSAFAIRRFIKSPYGRRIEAHRLKVFKKKCRSHPLKATMDGKRIISKRPKRINDRKGLGHMEGDFIVSGKSGKGIILTLTDRKVRKSLLERIPPVSVANVERALARMKRRYPRIQSITFDNDLLLLEHKRLEKKLSITIYFCHPRSPWEKPSIEHLNKILRRYIPKGSDISRYSRRFIRKLEEKVNRRFMECLGFLTPDEVYRRELKRKNRPSGRRKKKEGRSN
ncbi:IS30 family transposase [Patescibacteria group bacterium]|nr:IS30 family transposase [Patescibacteria group bacterium]